jgi:hypothetical protein
MAAAGAVMAGVGQVTQILSAFHEGEAQGQAADYNAQAATQNAEQTRLQAKEEERRARIAGRKHLGSMRAGYGASGVQMDGSALDVLEESARNVELDALTIRHAGEVRARGFENEAVLERMRGKNARKGGMLKAAGILFSAGGKAIASA